MATFKGLDIPEHWTWFPRDKFGLFIHWGPYSVYGRGEQVLFREHMDQHEYIKTACEWNPHFYDAKLWASIAKRAGFKYACLTTRHHDGYCLWDSEFTNYTSAKQAPKRDFVREFVDAFRAEGLKIGLYYSWLDWRIPAFFEGEEKNPQGWKKMRDYCHSQVCELLSNYGQIDYFFFDGSWPRNMKELDSLALIEKMRELQPSILINDRIGSEPYGEESDKVGADGDFGTPEHQITADATRLWESCQVANWRLWGYTIGEYWRSAEQLLDLLFQCIVPGGNLILNVGPDSLGRLPAPFVERMEKIGRWLGVHGEAVYGVDGGDLAEFIGHGYQTIKDETLYLILRFYDGRPELRVNDLVSDVKHVELLTTGQKLDFEKRGDDLIVKGLPVENPSELFPVVKVVCDGKPETNQWGRERLWGGDPQRVADWARTRGESLDV